jgi:hypothetical protein
LMSSYKNTTFTNFVKGWERFYFGANSVDSCTCNEVYIAPLH